MRRGLKIATVTRGSRWDVGELISSQAGGPSPPNYNGMTAAKADDAKKRYSIDCQKSREELCCEKMQAEKGELFDIKDYMGDLTPTLHSMAQVINSHLKKGHTFP